MIFDDFFAALCLTHHSLIITLKKMNVSFNQWKRWAATAKLSRGMDAATGWPVR